jgi:dual-specificity kinase
MREIFGDGTFGRCVKCTDNKTNERVAIKVIRDIPRYVDNAKIEVDVLQAIRKEDPKRKSHCVILVETFFHAQYFCLVFEPLAGSLYDLLKANDYRGMFVADIQTIGEQTAKALKFCASIDLTHTDLKPENILFSYTEMEPATFPRSPNGGRRAAGAAPYMRPVRADIKVIDFGNATFAHDHHASIINTRQYRGPEVILGLSWKESSDIWSLGCILMELYIGELFFATHENLEHLALMEKTLGEIPHALTSKARGGGEKLLRNGRVNFPEGASSESSKRHVRRTKPLPEAVLPVHRKLTDLVGEMLRYDPEKRPSAAQIVDDDFFRNKIPEV